MKKRLATILCLGLLGLALGGCTKCGWIWNDSPHACRADAPK
ncbi:MAG: peptidylprolyl isomerase [Pseudolabrys sp.]|nr:peptidylprolyl isomerase [Pseudolabrys sp.]